MYSSLNLLKPITRAQRVIEEKCGRIKKDEVVPMYQNILDGARLNKRTAVVDNTMTISTALSPNNAVMMEKILGNNLLYTSKYVRNNLTEILEMASSEEGLKTLDTILNPETLNKIETQRRLVKNNPRMYVHDRDVVQYANTPAGLSSMFRDINILKAAYALEPKALDSLFRMDITSEVGSDFLRYIGKMNLDELNRMKSIYKGVIEV